MPAQQASGSMVSKLGATLLQAHEAIKGNTTVPQVQMELPAGIQNGIAEIRSCKFMQVAEGKNNAGEWQFYASGVVKVPKAHNGIPVEGKRTFIIEPIYATPTRERKTIQDHMDHVYGLFRLWGVAPQTISAIDLRKDPQALDKLALAIEKAGIHIAFRTWAAQKQELRQHTDGKYYLFNEGDTAPVKGKGPYASETVAKGQNPYAGRDPMTNHQWGERVPYEDNHASNGQHMTDNSAPPAAPSQPAPEPFNEFGDAPEATAHGPEAATTPEPLSEDIDVLAEAAEDNNEARKRLKQLALEVGISEEVVNAAASWQDVAAMIHAATTATPDTPSGAPGSDAEESWKPEIGKVYGYSATVTNPKTKKKEKKDVQCEVKTIDDEKLTVTAVNNADKKTLYKDVTWEQLDLLEE